MLANSNVVLVRFRALSELQQKALEACWRCLGGVRTSAEGGQAVLTPRIKKAAQPSRDLVLAKKSCKKH